MKRRLEKESKTEYLSEFEFRKMLEQMILSLSGQLSQLQNLENQMNDYKANGYKLECFVNENGMPGFLPVKKPSLGFKTEK